MDATPPDIAHRSLLIQPISAGFLVGIVGYASTFAIVLKGLVAVGATQEQAASGLLALLLVKGVLAIGLGLRSRMPISIAWSSPGAALLIVTAMPAGGFPVVVGAFLVSAGLIVAAGLWAPFGRAVSRIPIGLASAMLAGILFGLCTAPVKAVAAMPSLALPAILVWLVALRFARPYAVPLAVIVTGIIVALATPLPPGVLADIRPHLDFVAPAISFDGIVGIAIPLFVVTMASQNVPGLAVLAANRYHPPVGPLFVWTGLASAIASVFGGHAVNLAAITAALCAGPEAHPDPARRWIASVTAGATYLVLGLLATSAAAFVAASPPVLIESVAGLALLGSLAGALQSALEREEQRLPAIVTFVTAASGTTFFGVGSAFWGLVVGGVILLAMKAGLGRSGARK